MSISAESYVKMILIYYAITAVIEIPVTVLLCKLQSMFAKSKDRVSIFIFPTLVLIYSVREAFYISTVAIATGLPVILAVGLVLLGFVLVNIANLFLYVVTKKNRASK